MAEIALIDDDPVEAMVLEGLLSHGAGRHVLTAFTSVEAFARLHHPGFDLVLLDRRVPPHQGFQSSLDVLKDSPYRGPLVLITAAVTPVPALSGDFRLHGPIDKSALLTPEALDQLIQRVLGDAHL